MGELRGVGLSVLLLVGGLLAVRGVAGESAPRRAAEAKAAAADDDASAAPAPAGACSAGQQLIDEYRALYGGERSTFRHLIVLIPDPVALRGRESFDSVFEGVEEAFAQSIDGAHYVRDRHWFPWTDAPAAAACWEQEPGVVIYRPVAGTRAPPILALFVGETPTWGLRVAATRRALALAAAPAPPSRQSPFRYHPRAELVSRLIAIAGELNAGRGAGAPPAPGIDDLTATLVAIFIPRYVRHFRTIAPQLVVSGIAGILLTSLYFAQPQRYIATVVFMWTAVTVVAVFACYLALVRDPVLAAIAAPGGAGGAIKWPIVRRVVAWLLLPAASLLPVQFPEVSLWVTQLLTGLAKGFE